MNSSLKSRERDQRLGARRLLGGVEHAAEDRAGDEGARGHQVDDGVLVVGELPPSLVDRQVHRLALRLIRADERVLHECEHRLPDRPGDHRVGGRPGEAGGQRRAVLDQHAPERLHPRAEDGGGKTASGVGEEGGADQRVGGDGGDPRDAPHDPVAERADQGALLLLGERLSIFETAAVHELAQQHRLVEAEMDGAVASEEHLRRPDQRSARPRASSPRRAAPCRSCSPPRSSRSRWPPGGRPGRSWPRPAPPPPPSPADRAWRGAACRCASVLPRGRTPGGRRRAPASGRRP